MGLVKLIHYHLLSALSCFDSDTHYVSIMCSLLFIHLIPTMLFHESTEMQVVYLFADFAEVLAQYLRNQPSFELSMYIGYFPCEVHQCMDNYSSSLFSYSRCHSSNKIIYLSIFSTKLVRKILL